MQESETKKPWEERPGRTLPLAELREVSRDWSSETWEKYLETIEGAQNDIIVGNFDETLKKFAKRQLESTPEEPARADRDVNLEPFLKQLPASERAVIRAMFFEGLSEREAGEKLNLTRRAILTLKYRGLKLLRSLLSSVQLNNVHPFRRQNVMVGGYLPQVSNRVAVPLMCQ